jgi:hypothetical protein
MVTMKIKPWFVWAGVLLTFAVAPALRADVLEMQNGDRYSGKVLSMSANIIVLNSEVLGRINVPRSKVASMTFGTNSAPVAFTAAATTGGAAVAQNAAANIPNIPLPVSTNLPIMVTGTPAATTNVNNPDLSSAFRQLGMNTNFIGEIRQQMFAGNPQASAKYDEMVNSLLSGQLNMGELRRQAQASADQLRELKRGLPEAGDALDSYLQILDSFLKETANEPANATP